jgi:uncharacterized protein YxjI
MSETTALTRYQSQYVAKKALFSFLGSSFRLFDQSGNLSFFVKQKAFKLKEEITVYADEGEKDAQLRIKARSIMDVSATYDVTDANSGEVVGALQRKGLKSILRDEWAILDTDGNEVGKVIEDSGALALLRRFIKLIPQNFDVSVGDTKVGQIKQHFNPFMLAYDVDFSSDPGGKLDPRLAVAAVVLLLAIEGRQK